MNVLRCLTHLIRALSTFSWLTASVMDTVDSNLKEVLLVPLIISLLQIHRTIPRFWSAYNKSPCKQQGLFVKA